MLQWMTEEWWELNWLKIVLYGIGKWIIGAGVSENFRKFEVVCTNSELGIEIDKFWTFKEKNVQRQNVNFEF